MQATFDRRVYPYRKTQERSLLYIAFSVTFVHVLAIVWAALVPSEKIAPFKPAERLVVKTIDLKPAKPQQRVQAPIEPIAETAPQEVLPEPISAQLPEPVSEPAPVEIAIEQPVPEPDIELIPVPEPLVEKPKPKPEVKKLQPKKDVPKPKKDTPKPVKKETLKKPAAKKETVKDKPKPKPKDKPVVQKNVAKKVPEKPKVNAQADKAQEKQRELLAKAQQSIANIDKTRGKIATSKNSDLLLATALPGRIDSLQVESLPNAEPLTVREIGYRDELASRLRLLLKLPEHGEVKVKLTLERSGKVAKLVIVNSQSAVNRAYIEKKVPGLSFPAFGNNFEGEAQYTFLIALSNEL